MFKPHKERKETSQPIEKKRWEQSITYDEFSRFSTKKMSQKAHQYGKN